MAETATVAPIQGRKLQTNQGHISGRIASKRVINTQQGKLHLTVLKLGAVDQYSHPATIEVRSHSALGNVGEDWNGVVKLGGMPNRYSVTNEDTGEKEPINSARNEYTVIED